MARRSKKGGREMQGCVEQAERFFSTRRKQGANFEECPLAFSFFLCSLADSLHFLLYPFEVKRERKFGSCCYRCM